MFEETVYPELRIRSIDGGPNLRLHKDFRDSTAFFWAELDSPAMSCRVRVHAAEDNSGIASFFEALAESWQNQRGVRSWSSLAGELRVECESGESERMAITITISEVSGHTWRVRALIACSISDLKSIATAARWFESGLGGTA